MPALSGFSFSHPRVPADRRALLFIDGHALPVLHQELRANGQDAFFLATCLRSEIVWSGGPEKAPELLTSIFGDSSMSASGVMRSGESLFLHLCRIVAGLDSPAPGESEVLGQFRLAVGAYCEGGAGSADLARILQSAVAVGRSARRNLGKGSASSLGAEAARMTVEHSRIAVLGAGAMARSVVDRLPPDAVTIFARRPGRVSGHPTRPWEESLEALSRFPAVVSTVPGGDLFSEVDLRAALSRRTTPLLLVDLGMPPGFPPHPDDEPVVYRGIDEVASSMQTPPDAGVDQALASEASSAWSRLDQDGRVGRLIAAMIGQAEAAVDEEVRRFTGRLATASNPEAVMRQLAHTVSRRVLHPTISYVGSAPHDDEGIEILAEAFGVTDD